MNDGTPSANGTPGPASPDKLSIKIVGIGGAGIAVIERLIPLGLEAVEFIAINTDAGSIARSSAATKILLESKLLRGMGTGGDPERGRQLAEEELPKLKPLFDGASAVFIVAGFGGGAGTGMSPVVAKAAKEAGALTLGFVTTPFDCEGSRRRFIAQEGLEAIKAAADGVICLPNQKVLKLIDENTSIIDTFNSSNDLLAEAVQGIWRLLAHRGLIEIHFADFCGLMRDRHVESALAVAEAAGLDRSSEVVQKLLAHPLLDNGDVLGQSDAILVSLLGGPDLTMAQINRVMEQIQGRCEKAQIMMGAAVNENFRDRLAVTLIAVRKGSAASSGSMESTMVRTEDVRGNGARAEELDTQLLKRGGSGFRPASRFIPPPPALPPEKMDQILSRQGNNGSNRTRKSASKMRQTQLPLEIISKGRFDKSEPTIHHGEDLDVPTYIRRGVALN
jgi:cell division protein FtsZ